VKNDIPTLEIPFMDMLEQILLILGLPIVVGMLFAHYFPNGAKRLMKPTQWMSIILFMGMVAVALSQVLTALDQKWVVYAAILCAFVIVIIHNATALSAGYFTGRLAKVATPDRRSLTIETGIQNSGLGLALLFNPAIFDPTVWSHNGGMIIITALWGVWHIVSGLSVATTFRNTNI
jgi:BASS family bile acid:Na+ symporter